MAADDVMGKIEFQAPDEGTGTDAVLVAAAIQAVSEGDFSSSSNATRLEFMTGASEAATSQMTISSGGIVGVGAGVPGDLGVGLHIKSADSGASVSVHADELVIEGSANSGMSILSGTSSNGRIMFGDSGDNDIGYIEYDHSNNALGLGVNTSTKIKIDSSGHVLPGSDDAQDLGSSSLQFRDIYTGDLNLNNTRHRANEVDGTSGSWTIQEGDDNLYILNRLNGKKYKFKLEEIE
jgi:hypothetical protein